MDEFKAVLRARQFIKDAEINSIPANIDLYAARANAKIKVLYDLDDDESGQTFPLGNQTIITVNGNHSEERQRFTVLHEIAHIVLGLPSNHQNHKIKLGELLSYKRRPEEEILCDVFAAECLLPYNFFLEDVNASDVEFSAIKILANKYKASITSTGSRYAFCHHEPCAFVLIENGAVRYASRSKTLRERGGWIDIGAAVPKESIAYKLINSSENKEEYDEIPSYIWFNDKIKDELISEEAFLVKDFNQCLSLILIEEGGTGADSYSSHRDNDDEPLLRELDGILPWPSKSRR